jgi:hypothetical protein
MKKPSISELVLRKVHRPQKATDNPTFLNLIQRCLVPEVREEVQRYFGKIDCLEAQYPGLDYTLPAHRRRLGIFTWHRRLFRAFDELGLTNSEILSLCTWEGTRAAKERFERESGTTIETTTLDGVAVADEGVGPRAILHTYSSTSKSRSNGYTQTESSSVGKALTAPEDLSDEEDVESVGVYLNQNLMAAASARARGEPARFDQQWEQWMKEALERDDMDVNTILETIRAGRPLSSSYSAVEASSSSQRPVSRHGLNSNLHVSTPSLSNASMMEPEPQEYDQLHDMLDELQTSNARISADNAALTAAHADVVGDSRPQSTDHARLSTLAEELQTNATRLEAENNAMASFLSRSNRTETAR